MQLAKHRFYPNALGTKSPDKGLKMPQKQKRQPNGLA
jgi:hypothetical protein